MPVSKPDYSSGQSTTTDLDDGTYSVKKVIATTLPLPTGAATAANQSTANSSLSNIDGKLPALVGGKIPVDASVSITGGATEAKQDTIIGHIDGLEGSVASIAGLSIPAHDYIALSYTGTNLTGVVYKTGGSGGTTVGTLTLAYSGSQLTSVTKS